MERSGVWQGIGVALNAHNQPVCYGASMEEAIPYAVMKAKSTTGEVRDSLLQWIKTAMEQIKKDRLEARVDKEYKERYEALEGKHFAKYSTLVRELHSEALRNEIRKNLRPE